MFLSEKCGIKMAADSEEWFVGEDGCLSVSQPADSVTYHSTLNTILVATKEPSLKVIDVTSGSVLQNSDLSAFKTEGIQCCYLPGKDKVWFTDGYSVGVRKDLNGVLLLDTALQTSVGKTEDVVKVELPLPEASHLFKCLMSAELPGVDCVEEVLRELEKEIEAIQQATKGNHKVAKWATVCLQLPHYALKTVCSNLVLELKRIHQHVPGLPIASAVNDRLSYLLPGGQAEQSSGTADRSFMYSEAARRETFAKWPHMNYKWALPDPMAQAGFYHQPGSTGDDRAMCFTCNVCLVCWEPTDEPWSEHERHSPTCPFVKGEYTQNVPMSVTYATEPAQLHGSTGDKIECVSTTSYEDLVATSSIHGGVVVWSIARQLKKHIQFNIDPWESVIAAKTGTVSIQQDTPATPGTPKPHLKEAWTEKQQTENSTESNPETVAEAEQSTSSKESSADKHHQGKAAENQHQMAPDYEETDAAPIQQKQQQKPHKPEPPEDDLPKFPPQNINPSIMCNGMLEPSEENSGASDNPEDHSGHAEIIEVSGAWRQGNSVGDIVEIPLDDLEAIKRDGFQRCRPSQDVLVSALCVLGAPHTPSKERGAAAVADHSRLLPGLVSGVAIRKNTLSMNNIQIVPSVSSLGREETKSDVQAMNQVNQAMSEDSLSQIICDEVSSSSSRDGDSRSEELTNPFVPYLLVHDICKSGQPLKDKNSKDRHNEKIAHPTSSSGPTSGLKLAPGGSHNMYMPQIMEMEEDPDVQIIGVVPPPLTDTTVAKFNTGSILEGSDKTDSKVGSSSGANTSENKGNSEPEESTGLNLSFHKEGRVLQCIELPKQVGTEHYVSSITPTMDGHHVVVVVAPKCLNRKIECISTYGLQGGGEEEEPEASTSQGDEGAADNKCSMGTSSSRELLSQNSAGGCLLILKLKLDGDVVMLDEKPVKVCVIDNMDDSVTSVLMLPLEVSSSTDDEETHIHSRSNLSQCSDNEEQVAWDIEGQMAVTTHSGSIKIIRLADFKVLANILHPEEDQFVSLTYCSGMDRLCGCTQQGRLYFYIIGPRTSELTDSEVLQQMVTSRGGAVGGKDQDLADSGAQEPRLSTDDLLVKQPLTTEVLTALHELTIFENLMPRFTATMPPCWSEIQQEQQQRRHPQHLQQQGEATQHTRTWRLLQDSTSWDEHLFELVLPKPCCVGHIDLKFTLHPLCTSAPNIQVTLLKQNISNRRHVGQVLESGSSSSVEVDTKIDFNMQPEELNGSLSDSPQRAVGVRQTMINSVLGPDFLEKHGAEILCGPVDISGCVDLSGHSGMIALTGLQLLKVKSKSFLVHLKAVPSEKEDKLKDKKICTVTIPPTTSVSDKQKEKASKPAFSFTSSMVDRLATSTPKQKMENVKGCDWLQEISITIRKSKKTVIPRDRVQRCAMVKMTSFHEQLLVAACGQDDRSSLNTSIEHRQMLALDILAWITSVQMNDMLKRIDQSCVVFTVQSNLKALVKACFIEAGRTVGHKCAKLIALCIEFTKNLTDADIAPAFNYALLQSLLECLVMIPSAYSAGSLHWYFTLLNRVKCMDIGLTGHKCADMLSLIARHYHDRTLPLHSLLKARFGLYASPLEPDLFDMDPPQVTKPGQQSNTSYSTVASTATNAAALTTATSSPSNGTNGTEELDFRDLLSLLSTDKTTQKSQMDHVARHICGLLEVEPLHFMCHATSDGTRMERMDTVGGSMHASTSNTSGLSGTINFAEGLSSVTAAGAALASLSTAMASAEQQLQLLQQKQQQLFKLQQQKQKLEQKLAETQKNVTSTSPAPAFVPYSSELFPPTPKTTPLFMTPPVTPPNEVFQAYVHPENDTVTGKPPTGKNAAKGSNGRTDGGQQKPALPIPQTQHLLQPPPPQVLVIERMHSGARRFVVLDFGKPILLTDVIIPACGDLASLSIDVWVHGEEIDGQRLVVSSDIGIRSLIMTDLMPPPICRYLKITTIGRYGGSTTKSRIPIGSFYGHTFILPWEQELGQNSSSASMPVFPETVAGSSSSMTIDQSQILSQLSMFITLQEDIQCRYSLACNRLETLLSLIDLPQNNHHTQYYLRKGKKSEEDSKVHQAYNDCVQLQLQLNLAQRAIERLQKALGIKVTNVCPSSSTQVLLKQASTDKLRVLVEFLLDTLLSMTYPSPSIPQLPVSLYTVFNPQYAEALFKNLCVIGSKQMQIHAGMLLVRTCGSQSWWGDFIGNILQEFFSSEHPDIFPQHRVFILLTALGQKSLTGSCASEVLESILGLLAKLLAPLLGSQQSFYRTNTAMLDLSLIGWLLLFLSRNLDNTSLLGGTDDSGISKDKDGGTAGSNRWDFIQGETAMQNSKLASKSSSSKLYRRKLQKRLMHHKQQLLDLQQAKKNFLTLQMEKNTGLVSKEAEAFMKQQEQMFKKQLKQYSSKHFKDIMQIRRTDGELLKKLPKDSSGATDKDNGDSDGDLSLILPREKCIPVVRGLMALILSMDFTCNVDLFLVACKVVARITNNTRPAISLSEVMSQEELERLILLCANNEYNHGNISWGGAWSGHAITCLLQDILEGEKLYPSQVTSEPVTDDDMNLSLNVSVPIGETDDALQNGNVNLPTIEEEAASSSDPAGAETSQAAKENSFKFDKESSLIVDMLLDDEEYDDETNAKLQEYITGESLIKPPSSTLDSAYPMFNVQASEANDSLLWPPLQQYTHVQPLSQSSAAPYWTPPAPPPFEADEKKQKFESWKSKLASIVASKANVAPQGVSTAMDARLEYGLDVCSELRLKVMLSLEAESVQNAISASLPTAVPNVDHNYPHHMLPPTDDEQLSEAGLLGTWSQQVVPSVEMLSTCFNNLFAQLQFQRVNLDTLLLLWLTLNDEASQDDTTSMAFDPSRVPSIALNETSITSLLMALTWTPSIPVRTWVLAFQTLTLLTNLKVESNIGAMAAAPSLTPDFKWLAAIMVADSNLMTVLIKFLSGTSMLGPVTADHQTAEVGPTASNAFHWFLVRLQLRCAEDNENHLKELMLKLVYMLTAEGGAFHSGLGPLDAQCKLLDHILDQSYDSVDISNAISVIETISSLVHHHIDSQERISCRSATENSVSARSCFGGLFASMLRPGDSKTMVGDANRDVLMCNLLKLVNTLVQIKLPTRGNSSSRSGSFSSGTLTADGATGVGEDHPMTDSSKLNQSLAAAAATAVIESDVPKSDDEKSSESEQQRSEGGAAGGQQSAGQASNERRSAEPEVREPCLTDIVLGHNQIMLHLIQALSCCNSNTMAMILGTSGLQSTMQDSFTGIDPVSVGDGVFQILCTLHRKATDIKLVLKPLFAYLSVGFQGPRLSGISKLSEPLLWLTLRVLEGEKAILTFLEMGGIEVVCNNLVNSNRRVINTSPSLISTIMQYLGNSKGASSMPKRTSPDAENPEGLHNFAPLGCISSSSPTAGPADVLIQASAMHRRARSAAWSYHFYPDEAWMDLTISLPCAILLKEVRLKPHLTSLATCPSSVSLEVSRDGSTMIPVCAPVATSGLTYIKLQLQKTEVVTTLTIRLHKPRDATTIGLSQILVLGYTAFGDAGSLKASTLFLPTEDYVSKTSLGWLRLLHHCLTSSEAAMPAVAAAAAPTSNLLVTCTALLVSPSSTVYATSIEAVLLKIGLHSTEMGLALIDNMLRNTPAMTDDAFLGLPLHGKLNGMANESTVDILYQLGMTQDAGTADRVQALAGWLGDNARVALQRTGMYTEGSYRHARNSRMRSTDLPSPAPVHIHCVAAILWQSQELPVSYNLKSIITRDLLSSVYEWSTVLPPDCVLKKSVDALICAMCYIHPEYFSLVLEWMGIIINLDINAAITDDHKGEGSQYQQQQQHRESMTDDSKEANLSQELLVAPGTSRDTDDIFNLQPLTLQEFGHMMLDESHLTTLAVACQSPLSLKQLLDSGFPAVLAQGLYEFCTREIARYSDSLANPEVFSEACRTLGSMPSSPRSPNSPRSPRRSHRSRTESESSQTDKTLCITADLVAPVLRFLAAVSSEAVMKDWLGSPEGNLFWPMLLSLLCNTPAQASMVYASPSQKQKVMTSQQRASIETATVEFFTEVISCHAENQHLFANVLCDVIKGQGSAQPGVNYTGSQLSGFTRRLFLQVLLEDEKVLVAFRSQSQLYKGQANTTSTVIQHPRYGSGHRYRTMAVSLQSTCGDILSKVSDTPSLTAQLLEARDEKKNGDEPKKDTSELGIEVVDQISAAAGISAKEKRDKSFKAGSPPRPATRRGHRGLDTASLSSTIHVPVLSLYHQLLPSQPLPAEMTLAQLLVLLHERGFPHGQAALLFSMKLHAKKVSATKSDKRVKQDQESVKLENWDDPSAEAEIDAIPDEVLLDTPNFPSALQVFASVGGLALLAEHLPLLYPEVTRQVGPQEVSCREGSNPSGLGQDWVTVESSEDMYEEIYQPVLMPPDQSSQPTRQTTASLPTIPPHSLVAFGLFLRLPGYAEVLLKERKRAQCLLRLVLGVTDDGEGGHILTSPIAGALPTLPFGVLKTLFDSTPLTTDDGVLLRRMTLEIGALHLILACLSVLSHHGPRIPIPGFHQEIILAATQAAAALASTNTTTKPTTEEKNQNYWAKGTGFGTGSTTSSWDAEQALLRQKSEEEHVTGLLQVLASYINPGGTVPKNFKSEAYEKEHSHSEKNALPQVLPELLSQSCLVPTISSYLRNDSVLDMARHVPLYRSLLELLRGVAVCQVLVPLLLPLEKDDDASSSISSLLDKMKTCVDTYASRLKTNKGKVTKNRQEEDESEGLALLIPDIQETAKIVTLSSRRLREKSAESQGTEDSESESKGASKMDHSEEEHYIGQMRELQFDTFEMVQEEAGTIKFLVPHHYESNVKAVGEVNNAARARRLAQEAVTLSTSLPLSASSSVFVRCDEERLDVMKVMITGPGGTPYGNGCFEFDVYFPQDYPNSPPLINLETTGNHSVRFNPNLYNDGKVCLSVLNTWHGRPEEKWNSQTSSFLQVLVSIQSLILVSEPYFNEPGYERSRGTPSGTASSREYDANIRQATVKWAMLEMIRNSPPAFKDVIHRHFWMKKREIVTQVEEWIADMEANSNDKRTGRTISHSCVVLKRHFNQLKEELAKLKPPEGLEEDEDTKEEVKQSGEDCSANGDSSAGPSTSADNGTTANGEAAPAAYNGSHKHVENGPKLDLLSDLPNDVMHAHHSHAHHHHHHHHHQPHLPIADEALFLANAVMVDEVNLNQAGVKLAAHVVENAIGNSDDSGNTSSASSVDSAEDGIPNAVSC